MTGPACLTGATPPRARFRAAASLGAALVVLAPAAAAGQPEVETEPYRLVRQLMAAETPKRRAAAKRLERLGDPRLLPALVDALFFTTREHRAEMVGVLRTLSGHRGGDRYHEWVEQVGARAEIEPFEGYRPFKASLFSGIDPRYAEILGGEGPARLRLEEIVWGGVSVEGIPALERPPKLAGAARVLGDRDLVLGVGLGGAHHAYPVKVLSWHEMVNDEVGGEPITLSYCTLCGSAVLYATRRPGGEVLTFGTSGLLYRSNKLMIDRSSGSLWSNLAGEAVLGPAAAEPARLEPLPVTLARWGDWLRAHPDTTLMAHDPVLGQRYGFLYEEGAADRARAGVSFPVWQQDDRLPPRTEVLALRIEGRAKAYELGALQRTRVLNDRLGAAALVIVVDEGGAARAYRRADRELEAAPEPGLLVDQSGARWRAEEDALHPVGGAGAEPLPRLPSHVAFWFGWYGFYPDTELWAGP
jgi:hypothetical protein